MSCTLVLFGKILYNILMKVLVINGHKYYSYAQGKLNKTLFDTIVDTLKPLHEIKTTVIQEGYDAEEEIAKFLWADIIVFQTPVNWFGMPGMFKTYVDEIYRYGVFYGPSESYGKGGLLKGKKYMYSLTWNTPREEFNKPNGFFDNKSVDDVIIAMHKLQEFCALEKIETFSVHDVVKNPNVPEFVQQLKEHLKTHI